MNPLKILLVTRGSQGDIYPYLIMAEALLKEGYTVTLNLPRLFEKEARAAGVRYVLQGNDDIAGMVEQQPGTRGLLEWTRRVIDNQFEELIPLLQEHDLMISSNTEFAAPTIAEYCKKPLIRTAFGPFLPGRKIPPPVFPIPKPHPVLRPALLWKALNMGLNMMVKKQLNGHRRKLGLPPIKDQGEHAPSHADNFLMYSPSLGTIDMDWKYRWHIGGYCFNDDLPYDGAALQNLLHFIRKDEKPVIFFTLGSCNTAARDQFTQMLFEICLDHKYKLVVGCGWWNVGSHLEHKENLFLLDKTIPHYLIFPACDAIIHHGGSGTTHSAARAGKPQLVAPLLIDQHYWAYRVASLQIGSGNVNIAKISKETLEKKVLDLMTNVRYKENAAFLGEKIRGENGIQSLCDYIQRMFT